MGLAIKIIKGMLIGTSVVIPGVSGGTMAVSMGIYDQLIDLVTVSRSAKKRFAPLLPYLLGIVFGVALFSYFIESMFADYPLQTAFLFCGLILGAMPMLIRKVKPEPFRISHAVILLCTISLMLILPLKSPNAGDPPTLTPSLANAALCLLLGLVAAATMVVPGVSGSMILMLLGYYEPVLKNVNGFTISLLRLDMPSLLTTGAILLPLGIGMLLGIVLMARIIRALLKRFPYSTYYAIIGLVVSSPFAVLYQQHFVAQSFWMYALYLFVAACGFFLAVLLSKEE